jgi:hypothetical protein
VSGGVTFISGAGEIFIDRRGGNGWSAGGDNFNATVTNGDLTVYAYCSPGVTQLAEGFSASEINKLEAAQRALH